MQQFKRLKVLQISKSTQFLSNEELWICLVADDMEARMTTRVFSL